MGWRVMSVQDRAQRASPPNTLHPPFVAAYRGPIWPPEDPSGLFDYLPARWLAHISQHIGRWSNIFTCLSTDCLVPVTKTVLVQMMLHCVYPPLHNHLHHCESIRSETGCYVVSGKHLGLSRVYGRVIVTLRWTWKRAKSIAWEHVWI